jgi:REP element-mobilizing transposase RayT
MSRPLRLEHAGALWHATSRGNERRDIFRDDRDRQQFLETLGRVVAMFRWRLYAWVLMNNHYHLLFETPEPTLSRGMRQLNGIYTQRFNRRHGRSGHLMQGRFKGILVQKEAHLLELCRYVVLNPVRAGAARSARTWRWSSYRATAGFDPAPEWLDAEGVLSFFASRRPQAEARYRAFVSEGVRSGYAPWKAVSHQILLGGAGFVEKAQRWMSGWEALPEIPLRQRSLGRPGLETIATAAARAFAVPRGEIRKKRGGPVRLAVALAARRRAALPLDEIGAFLGVRSWSVSHMATAAEKLAERDPAFRKRMATVLDDLG